MRQRPLIPTLIAVALAGCVVQPATAPGGPELAEPGALIDLDGPVGAPPLDNQPKIEVNRVPDFEIQAASSRYIVRLGSGRGADVAKGHGLHPRHTYSAALNGFAAELSAGELARLRRDPRVAAIDKDGTAYAHTDIAWEAVPQIPYGIYRSQGPQSGIAAIAGDGDAAYGFGVAVIDSGVDIHHEDLNVAGGINTITGADPNAFDDDNSHGTHVAGTIGAKDQGIGVVGMAPGIGIYAVKVLNAAGSGSWSDVIAGIDWVTANGAALDIRVANMSLGGGANSAVDAAVRNSIAAGVTYVVSAGNDNKDAKYYSPARVAEAITVASLNDTDGRPGGLGPSPIGENKDDQISRFSNYGTIVDVAAPGLWIVSTVPAELHPGGYQYKSGTSMAAPHISGEAALYVARYRRDNGGASPPAANVQSALKSSTYSLAKGQTVVDLNGDGTTEGGYFGKKGTWRLIWAGNLD